MYDASLAKVLMFGGQNSPSDLLDWNGSSWTQILATGPPARSRHALVFDEYVPSVILYGGFGGAALDDAWQLKGGAWSLISAGWTGTSRQGFAMGFDRFQGKALVFGGRTASGVASDLRVGLASTAVVPAAPGPSPIARGGQVGVFDPDRKTLVVIGGSNTAGVTFPDATWELQMSGQPCMSPMQCPSGYCAAGYCCDSTCDGNCRACDKVNTALGAIDGTCQKIVGKDPRFCQTGNRCYGRCTEAGTCTWEPEPCALCKVCNATTGACDTLPPNDDDPNCEGLTNKPGQCSEANLSCRKYATPTVKHRCIDVGQCGWKWSDCIDYLGDSCAFK